MKHTLTAAVLALIATNAWATYTPEPQQPEPPTRSEPRDPDVEGGNRDVEHGCLTRWSTAEQRLIPCDEVKPVTTGPKGQIIFEPFVVK